MSCVTNDMFSFRIMQTISERNTIPCEDRVNGMVVVVVRDNFRLHQLQTPNGGDMCNNNHWKVITIEPADLIKHLGAEVDEETPTETEITTTFLNNKYPEALSGFRITIVSLNSTFMKVGNDKWVLTNDILDNENNP